MDYTRRKRSRDASTRAKIIASILAVGAAFAVSQTSAHADPVASDGAVGVNAQWEAGTSPNWYIELQRQGIYSVDDGMRTENDAEIRAGLQQFDWGFAHQGSNGSFPGTAGGSIGQEFHSTSLFLEAVARAAIELKSYSPITYKLDDNYYNSKISQYTAAVDAAAHWMTRPSVAIAGQKYNFPFTHRRYLLAATLAEAGALTGDSSFSDDAVPYVEQGLARQLGRGWTAAVTKNADGTFPPAVLQSPGTVSPSGTYETLTAVGVNPEKGGYDTEYQCTGLFYANIYYQYCTDSDIRRQLLAMTRAGLNWESGFVNDDGTVSTMGDSRAGVEDNREGDVKTTTKGITWAAFALGAQNTGDAIDAVYEAKIAAQGLKIDTDAVSAYGAADGNEAWEHDKSLPWYIGNQKIGVDYVEAGIAEENDSLIQEGLLIFNWGFIHQKANGSFGTTASSCGGSASFIEAAARAANDLTHYAPLTYQPSVDYTAWAQQTLDRCARCCEWMLKTGSGRQSQVVIANSSSRNWEVAAALAETGKLTDNSDLQNKAHEYAANAINLQKDSGEEPENGDVDVNNQAVGMGFAFRYAVNCNSDSKAAATFVSLYKGLTWESQFVGIDGLISGTATPARVQIQHTFSIAATLPIKTYYQIVRYRLGDIPVE